MTRDQLKDYIGSKYASLMTPLDTGRFDPMFEVKADRLFEVSRALRDDENLKLDFLCNMHATDTRENFEIVYSIASITTKLRLDFKIVMPYQNAEIDSVQEVWPAANWYEREMWELFGINVKNHGNLKRFLLPDDWNQGHPMRKDWDAPDFVRMPEIQ
ncbi:MAG: NADH-quinone oxidoreductase subunit C [Candidatus Zixiibacteriota bacterium]|nr:MAG: NADH-quinone oxidoreductase subunit C [candidate division Zixibacteria bacterium]